MMKIHCAVGGTDGRVYSLGEQAEVAISHIQMIRHGNVMEISVCAPLNPPSDLISKGRVCWHHWPIQRGQLYRYFFLLSTWLARHTDECLIPSLTELHNNAIKIQYRLGDRLPLSQSCKLLPLRSDKPAVWIHYSLLCMRTQTCLNDLPAHLLCTAPANHQGFFFLFLQ